MYIVPTCFADFCHLVSNLRHYEKSIYKKERKKERKIIYFPKHSANNMIMVNIGLSVIQFLTPDAH